MSCNRTPPFWSLISNGEHIVGCTGQTVYVYDINNNLLAKFPKHKYVYTAAFSPAGDMFAVKSVEGYLAFYSLEDYTLLKKFRFSKVDGSQDDGYCFNSDGTEFYNIERQINSCRTALSIYSTTDFSMKKQLFLENSNIVLQQIEYDYETDCFYIMGFFRRDKDNPNIRYFVAKLIDDKIADQIIVNIKEYNECIAYLETLKMGSSKMAMEYFKSNKINVSEINIMTISTLWDKHSLNK